jgi:hypothetical protein
MFTFASISAPEICDPRFGKKETCGQKRKHCLSRNRRSRRLRNHRGDNEEEENGKYAYCFGGATVFLGQTSIGKKAGRADETVRPGTGILI